MAISRWAAAAAAWSVLTAWPHDIAAPPQTDRWAFEGYRPFTQDERLPWKEANDNVGRIGGWRAYAKEAAAAQAAAKARASARPAPAPAHNERTQP